MADSVGAVRIAACCDIDFSMPPRIPPAKRRLDGAGYGCRRQERTASKDVGEAVASCDDGEPTLALPCLRQKCEEEAEKQRNPWSIHAEE
jgi:hypothetical protein